jgi:hypothetical protein
LRRKKIFEIGVFLNPVRQIYLEKFCNSISLEMGLAVIKLAKKERYLLLSRYLDLNIPFLWLLRTNYPLIRSLA